MKKKTQPKLIDHLTAKPHRTAFIAIAIMLSLGVVAYVGGLLFVATQGAKQASSLGISAIVLNATSTLTSAAPVDFKTGDIYFPQARLSVPSDSSFTNLLYAYVPEDNYLLINSRQVQGRNEAQMYSARNTEEAIRQIPKLQACQRGIRLAYAKLKDVKAGEYDLRSTVRLNNGKDIYIYLNKSCQELYQIAELLKKVRAY